MTVTSPIVIDALNERNEDIKLSYLSLNQHAEIDDSKLEKLKNQAQSIGRPTPWWWMPTATSGRWTTR